MKQYTKWDKFELPQLTDNDYGIQWPKSTPQIVKELKCFKAHRYRNAWEGTTSAFLHFLNICQLLFPHKVDIYKDVPKGRVWNNYFLDIAEELCKFEDCVLTGPASANKTYGASVFVFASWISNPRKCLAMVSTTSGSASERRVWGDMKDFHREAKYDECGMMPVGSVVDYQKAIVFDPGKELGGAKKNNRDMRSAIQVIPIATDQSGDSALATVQGSKNQSVIWLLDEMAHMNDGVTRPNGNLRTNAYYQFIGIGNASEVTDPHGKECMPLGGIDAINKDSHRRWKSATGKNVLFVSGEESPNSHPFVDQKKIKFANEYPFPYASNELVARQNAIEYGGGDPVAGKKTVDYWKFSIGFWAPTGATSSLYSKTLFTEYGADKPHELLFDGVRHLGAGDFAFSVGGDSNTFAYGTLGYTHDGRKILNVCEDTMRIYASAESKEEFAKAIGREYANEISNRKIHPRDFGGDTGNDASLTVSEIGKVLQTHDIVGISTTGNSNRPDKYKNKVTELWFIARDLIKTGCVRGVTFTSYYFNQLIQRRYESLGKGYYVIERKRDMKKRIKRSPDDADAFIFLLYMAIRTGFFDAEIEAVRTIESAEEAEEHIAELKREPRPRVPIYKDEKEFQLTDDHDDSYLLSTDCW